MGLRSRQEVLLDSSWQDIRVGNNQIRLATGWENWTPSEENVRLLKDASQGLWDDSRGEGPGDEEMARADEELPDFRPIQEPRLHELQPLAPLAAAEAQPLDLATITTGNLTGTTSFSTSTH